MSKRKHDPPAPLQVGNRVRSGRTGEDRVIGTVVRVETSGGVGAGRGKIYKEDLYIHWEIDIEEDHEKGS